MQFHKKIFGFIWFHEFFCLDFFKFSGPLCLKKIERVHQKILAVGSIITPIFSFSPIGKHLSDLEILKQFEEVGSAIDDDMESECICGKTGLKYLYFIKNKLLKAQDPVEYATSEPIIGKYI